MGPPEPPPNPAHPTCMATGMVLVAAQVTLHIVDGSTVTVTEGAPTGDVTITVGLRDLEDIWGRGQESRWAQHCGAVLGCLNLTQRDYYGMGKRGSA